MEAHVNFEWTCQKFWSQVLKTDTCWLWQGSLRNKRYGYIQYKGHRVGVHVFSYMLAHNLEAPPELNILHKCDDTLCVRPEHLFEGTHADNMRDMISKGRSKLLRTGRAKGQKDVKQRVRRYYKNQRK